MNALSKLLPARCATYASSSATCVKNARTVWTSDGVALYCSLKGKVCDGSNQTQSRFMHLVESALDG
jgi:hypothetical protein